MSDIPDLTRARALLKRKEESYAELALNFENLFASCIRQQKPTHPIHCGHAKGQWFSETLAISPLDADCELRLRYHANGEIESPRILSNDSPL